MMHKMGALAFDTLAYSQELQAAGVPEKQANAQAHALAGVVTETLATKGDIADLRRDMRESDASLHRDMQEMEQRLKYDLTVRLGTMMAISVGTVAALVKLL